MHEVKVGRKVEVDHDLCLLQLHVVPVKQKKWTDQDTSSALDAVQHGYMKQLNDLVYLFQLQCCP